MSIPRAILSPCRYIFLVILSTAKSHIIIPIDIKSFLLANREFLFQALGLDSSIVVCNNPFVWTFTTRKNVIFKLVIWFKLNRIVLLFMNLNSAILQELKEKSQTLFVLRGPLFRIEGASPKVPESPLFYLIDSLSDAYDDT